MICRTDREWQLQVKDGGLCPMCRLRRANHAHHLIGRGVPQYRRDTNNGFAVCGVCHEDRAAIIVWLEVNRPWQYRWYQQHKNKVAGRLDRPVKKRRQILSIAEWQRRAAVA